MKPTFDNLPNITASLVERVGALEALLRQILEKLDVREEPMQTGSPNDLLTMMEVQEILRCKRGTIYNHIKNGLRFTKVGRKTLFKRKHVLDFEKQNSQLTSLKKSA